MNSGFLIMLGAGSEHVHAIKYAQSMGCLVLVLDRNPSAPGAAMADVFLPHCVYRHEEAVAGLAQWRENGGVPGGVLCVASDAPRTVAAIGEFFNLPAVSMETAHLATDKLAMKDRLAAHGIPVPWYAPLRDSTDLRRAFQERCNHLVIKPVDNRGARGVLHLSFRSDLDWAFDLACAQSPTGRVMVEEFLEGQQVSTEGLMIDGTAHIPGFADRNYEFIDRFAPHIIENGGDMPSLLPLAAQEAIRDLTGRAALALGLKHGPVKGDMLWHKEQAYVIEIAARHSGGYFVTHSIPWNTGVDLLGASIRMAMGEVLDPAELRPRQQKAVCQRYLFAEPGLVRSIEGVEEARRLPYVRYVEVRVKKGDVILPVTSHPARPGVVMAVAETREAAGRAALAAIRTIIIRTEQAP